MFAQRSLSFLGQLMPCFWFSTSASNLPSRSDPLPARDDSGRGISSSAQRHWHRQQSIPPTNCLKTRLAIPCYLVTSGRCWLVAAARAARHPPAVCGSCSRRWRSARRDPPIPSRIWLRELRSRMFCHRCVHIQLAVINDMFDLFGGYVFPTCRSAQPPGPCAAFFVLRLGPAEFSPPVRRPPVVRVSGGY